MGCCISRIKHDTESTDPELIRTSNVDKIEMFKRTVIFFTNFKQFYKLHKSKNVFNKIINK